jgi:hypothetical protein
MKTKTIFLSVFIALFSAANLCAQDKYEYATVVYSSYPNIVGKSGVIAVSKAKSYEEINVGVEKGTLITNFTPVLQHLETMNIEGWETFSVIKPDDFNVIYHLRKKKN